MRTSVSLVICDSCVACTQLPSATIYLVFDAEQEDFDYQKGLASGWVFVDCAGGVGADLVDSNVPGSRTCAIRQ